MNPAALKTNLKDLPKGGVLIVNTDAFSERNLQKAGYETSPLADGTLDGLHVHEVALTSMTVEALKAVEGITSREAERSKNFFALGLMSWLYHRPIEGTLGVHRGEVRQAPRDRRGEHPRVQGGVQLRRDVRGLRRLVRGRARASRAGPLSADHRQHGHELRPLGRVEALGLPLFLGAYPITPASSILEELARHKSFGVTTFQAEDEIAACGAALGASFGGALGVTTSAGPGIVLKAEMVGLGGHARAAAPDPRHPARRPVDRGCRRSRSRPTC